MIMLKPKKIKLVLMSNEIEAIIEELDRAPHNMYKYMNYEKIIDKLNKSLEFKWEKK